MRIKDYRKGTMRSVAKVYNQAESDNKGFTLVELLVALGIGLVILAALYNLFALQNQSFSVQETIVEMQQNARAAMDMMVTEARMAGYNPATATFDGITAPSANSITIKQDLNGDSELDDANESITYSYDSTNLRITRNTGGGAQPYAENIEALNFYYNGNSLGVIPSLSDIKIIKIEIRARTAKKDHNYGTNSGYRTYTLTSNVTPRNLAF